MESIGDVLNNINFDEKETVLDFGYKDITPESDYFRNSGIRNSKYNDFNFKNDDGIHPDITSLCKKYVMKYDEMIKNGWGIRFHGTCGTGKTFYACCIANALFDRRKPGFITTMTALVDSQLHKDDDIKALTLINQWKQCPFVVLDDFGSERLTEWMLSETFEFVNYRYSQKNFITILTTNVPRNDFENQKNLQLKRTYDRLTEMCPLAIDVPGKSRRESIADKNKKDMMDALEYWSNV